MSELFEDLKGLDKLKEIVLFLNSCNSGNIINQPYLARYSSTGQNELKHGKCRAIFASGLPDQLVDDSDLNNPEHSPFMSAIIDILRENTSKPKLPLGSVIYHTKEKLKQTNRAAKPMEGYYGIHGGEEFHFYLKGDESDRWQEAYKADSIKVYEAFLRDFSFSNSKYYNEARKKKDELITGRKALLNCIEDIQRRIKEFTDSKKTVELDDSKKAEELFETINTIEKDLTKKERSEQAWQQIKNNESISHFKDFEAEYPDSEYISQSKSIRKYLEEKQEEENDWEKIPKTKQTSARNRRARYAEFVSKYKFSKNAEKAIKKIKDLEYWIDADEEQDSLIKTQKLNEYLREIDDGEYKSNVKKLLDEADIEASAKELAKECEEYMATNNTDKLRDIKAHIEGMGEGIEREVNEDTYLLISEFIEKYETLMKVEYENAVAEDSVSLMVEFIATYPETEESILLKDRFYEKDRETFEEAMQTKDIGDFEYYLSEFGNYKGIYVTDVKEYIDELNLYHNLSDKEGYLKYLDDNPNGLMLVEARGKIQEIEFEEHKKEQFDNVMNNTSIELCENYLSEFDDEDDMRIKVEGKLKQLQHKQEKKDLYSKAYNSEGEKRLGFCNEYIIRFPDGEDIDEIKILKKKTEEDIQDNEALAKAKKEGTMTAFELYKEKHPKGLHITDADDFLLYLSIKNTEDITTLQKYLDENPDGLNKDKVLDHISFLEAKIKNTIEDYQTYINDNPNGIHTEDVRKLQEAILLNEKEEKFFQNAKKTDTIDGYWEYLRQTFPKKEANEKYAKKRMKELKELQEEKEFYNRAMKEDNERTYIEYIKKYDTDGTFYPQITQKLREKQTGLKELDLANLSNSVKWIAIILSVFVVFSMCAILYLLYKIQ